MNRGGRTLSRVLLTAIGVTGLGGVAAHAATRKAPPRRYVVEISGMAFHPAVLEVQRGDTVVWINRDIVPHTATATRRPGWRTGNLLQGASGRYVTRGGGEEQYFCELHPTMRGRLIIK